MSPSPVKSNESVTLAYASKSLQPPHPLDLKRETHLLFSDYWASSETDSSNLFYSSGIVPDSDGFANHSENINHLPEEEEEEEEEINDNDDSEYDEEDTFHVDEQPELDKNSLETNPCKDPINDSQLASILDLDIEKYSSRSHYKRVKQDDGTRLQKRAKTSYNRFSSEADNAVFEMSLPPSSPIYQTFSDDEEYDPTYLPKNEPVTTNNNDRMVTRSSLFLQHETAADSRDEAAAAESAAPSNSSQPLPVPLPDPQPRFYNNIFCYLRPEDGFKMAQKILTSAIDEGNPHLQLSNLSLQKIPPEISDIKDLVSLDSNIVVDLSENQLTDLGYDLFKITNMSVLNLCRNRITGIPPAIHNLTNLRVLELNGKNCPFLPAEIFSLQKLEKLTVTCVNNMPVPSKHRAAAASSKHRIQERGAATNMLSAPSAPAFKNMFRYWAEITSTSIPDEQLKVLLRISKAREYPVRDPSLQTEPDSKLAVGSASVTSLLSLVKGVTLKETILQLLADTGITQEHAAHLGEYFKDPIPELLQEAQQVHQSCGVCGRAPLVMPVASVHEWWFESVINQEIVFKRSFCSTRCFVAWAAEVVESVPDLF